MPRFSLAAGLGLVALTALGCAALMTPSTMWRQLTATVVILVLLLATAIAIAWQQPSRWFWGGFAVSGWLYVGLTIYGGAGGRATIVTNTIVRWLDDILQTSEYPRTPQGERVTDKGEYVVVRRDPPVILTPGLTRLSQTMDREEAAKRGYLKYAYKIGAGPSKENFADIAHYLFALIVALPAGWFMYWLRRKGAARSDRS